VFLTVSIATGLGYNGVNPKHPNRHLFDRLENISIHQVEFAPSPKAVFESWNKNTASWLKRSVYVRIISITGSVSAATYATYFISALWHGFRPGYYLTFMSGALITFCGRKLRRHLRPLFLETSKLHYLKPVYDILGWFGTLFLANYSVFPFFCYTVERSLQLWRSVYFAGHILMLTILIFFRNKKVLAAIDNLRRQTLIKKQE
jgi:lysophospholipid acyltransferase